MRVTIRTAAFCLLVLGLSTTPALATETWIKAESPHFIVYTDASEADARDDLRKLEAFETMTEQLYSGIGDSELPDYHKTTLHFLKNLSDFLVIRPMLFNGFQPVIRCPDFEQQLYSVASGAAPDKLEDYTRFDLAWMFYARAGLQNIKYFSKPLPTWVDSGLANYFMTVNIQTDRIIVGQPFPEILRDEEGHKLALAQLMPFEDIVAGPLVASHKLIRHFDANAYRFQTWLMVSYFMSDPERKARFVKYLEAVTDGADPLTAFATETGMQPGDFNAIFTQYMTAGSPELSYARKAAAEPVITITPVVETAQDLPLVASAIRSCPNDVDGKVLLHTARQIAGRYPSDPLAQMTLAAAAVQFGDLKGEAADTALPILDARLKADPNDVEARQLMGRLYLYLARRGAPEQSSANFARARTELGKAYQLDPTSAPTLYDYVLAHKNLPDFPDENTQGAMALAQSYSRNAYGWLQAEIDVRTEDYERALIFFGGDCHMCGHRYREAYLAIHDALAAKKPKADILALFAAYDAAEAKDR